MSRKVQQFANIITTPLNVHNFIVTIPGFVEAIVVESTTFPSDTLREMKLWFQGEEVRYPTIAENSGKWAIKIPENDRGLIRSKLQAFRNSIYDQKTGIIIPALWKDITVHARDLNNQLVFGVILHGAWIRGRNEVQLANSDPSQNWKWDWQFTFQWIEDIANKPV